MEYDYSQKIRSLMATVIAMVAVLPTTFVYAQTPPPLSPEESSNTTTTTSAPVQLITPSAAAQQIINNTKAECEQAQFLQKKCVTLVYESPTTVVLGGLVSIFGGAPESRGIFPNPFLWNAVDGFKAQGYAITDIEMTLGGNRSIDDEYNVIMSK
jgi:hypothetical protein